MSNINIENLLNKVQNEKTNIIDIRSNYEYNLGHIPTAINIDKKLLHNYLDKEKTYYIYCQSGITSSNIVNKLNDEGYKTVNILGGYHNYLLRK